MKIFTAKSSPLKTIVLFLPIDSPIYPVNMVDKREPSMVRDPTRFATFWDIGNPRGESSLLNIIIEYEGQTEHIAFMELKKPTEILKM